MLGIVYNSLFMTAILLLILMESFALYRRSFIEGKNRSTPISAAILFALGNQLVLDFFLPKLISGQNYFVAKFVITIFNFFFLVPLITILTNDKIVCHIKEMQIRVAISDLATLLQMWTPHFPFIFRPKRLVSPSDKIEPTSN